MNFTLADGRVLTLPTVSVGLIGEAGSGKSHFISGMEKPLRVIATDPMCKMQPYFDRGVLDPKTYTGALGQPVRLVRSRTSNGVIIQLEGYYDENPKNPQAMNMLFERLPQLREEAKAGHFKTLGIDSWSQLEYIAKQRRTYGPMAAKSKVWEAIDDLEQVLKSYLINLPCSLAIAMHIEERNTKDGTTSMFRPKALGSLRQDAPGMLGEMYRAVAGANGTGIVRTLQTQPGDGYHCATRIDAPNGCAAEYTAIFANWLKKQAEMEAASSPNPAADAAQKENVV